MGRGKKNPKPQKKNQAKKNPVVEKTEKVEEKIIEEEPEPQILRESISENPKITKKDMRATRENVLKMLQKLQKNESSTESDESEKQKPIRRKQKRYIQKTPHTYQPTTSNVRRKKPQQGAQAVKVPIDPVTALLHPKRLGRLFDEIIKPNVYEMIDYYFDAKMKFESKMHEKYNNYPGADQKTESETSNSGNVSDGETQNLPDQAAILKQMFAGIPRDIFAKDCKIEADTKSDAEKDSEPEKEFIDEQAALYSSVFGDSIKKDDEKNEPAIAEID